CNRAHLISPVSRTPWSDLREFRRRRLPLGGLTVVLRLRRLCQVRVTGLPGEWFLPDRDALSSVLIMQHYKTVVTYYGDCHSPFYLPTNPNFGSRALANAARHGLGSGG